MISREDIAPLQRERVLKMKTQSSPKISSGKGSPSPKGAMGNIRPAFQALK